MNVYPPKVIGQRHTPAQIEAREGAIERQMCQRGKARQRGDRDGVARWDERIEMLKRWRERD